MIDQLQLLFSRLRDAEYLHALLETLPLYGIFFGLVFFAIAFGLKDKKIQLIALGVILLSSLGSYPQLKNRRLAEPHMVELRGKEYGARIEAQTNLRASHQWAYFTLAGVGLLAIVARKSKAGLLLMAVTLTGAIAVLLLSTWLHMKDAEIRHPNINLGPGTKATVLPGDIL